MELVILWVIMGVVVAMVAKSKGRDPVGWFFYGVLVWPIALTHALLLEREPVTAPHAEPVYVRRSAEPSAPSISDLDRETFAVADEWRAEGRAFTMIEAKEEARLRLLVRTRRPAPQAGDSTSA